jgi:hypothetical protein
VKRKREEDGGTSEAADREEASAAAAPVAAATAAAATDTTTAEAQAESTVVADTTPATGEVTVSTSSGAAYVPAGASSAPPKDQKNKDRKDGRGGGKKQNQEEYLPVPDDVFAQLKATFGLTEAFEQKLLFTRSAGCKTMQMVTPDVSKLFLSNERAIKKRRVIHAGMKVFDKSNLGDQKVFRLCQEGVHLLLPFLTKGFVEMPASDFQILLDRRFNNGVPMDAFTDVSREALMKCSIGSVVCTLRETAPAETAGVAAVAEEGVSSKSEAVGPQGPKFTRMTCCVWRGKKLTKVLLSKGESTSLLSQMKSSGLYDPAAFTANKRMKRDKKDSNASETPTAEFDTESTITPSSSTSVEVAETSAKIESADVDMEGVKKMEPAVPVTENVNADLSIDGSAEGK